jgi:Zn-dependent protease
MEKIILEIALWALPVILAITLHEAAHGYVARMFGDPTAYLMGRVTLNPLKHVDPIGTLLVPGAIVLFNAVSGVNLPPFGWAKPVPVDFGRLRHPKADMLWVAAAGPAANLFQAVVWAFVFLFVFGFSVPADLGVLFKILDLPMDSLDIFWGKLIVRGILANLSLMLINLVPVPPLDGGRILVSLLPIRLAVAYSNVERYGFVILLALLYLHILDGVLWFAMSVLMSLLHLLTGA